MSALAESFAFQVKVAHLPKPEREYRFHPSRRWRFDFAWPDQRLALEIEGGIWIQGRHSRGKGLTADVEKYNAALLLGWRVLRATGAHVKSGDAVGWVTEALRLAA